MHPVGTIIRSGVVASGGGGSSPPVSGYLAQYDASDTATITQLAGLASQWNDKSANALHLVQGTALNQPTTNSRTINSLNTLLFNGSTTSMQVTQTLNHPITVFAIIQSDTISSGDRQAYYSGDNMGMRGTTYACDDGHGLSSGVTVDLNPHVLAMRDDGTQRVYLDSTTASQGSFGGGGSVIRAGLGGGSEYWNGLIGEIIVYSSSLSDADVTSTFSYLKAKWGTP